MKGVFGNNGPKHSPNHNMNSNSFDTLNIIQPILKALQEEGYSSPTPIQAQTIPYLLDGRDVLGCAQTGTGKTAAFAIPVLQNQEHHTKNRGYRPIRTLILTPTRELAIQIDESFTSYGRHLYLRHSVIFGGVGQAPQVKALKKGVDILTATPGRLLDLMNQGFVDLRNIEMFILDEADRMLDMGFINDVRKVIAKLPAKRQNLLFSATMPSAIAELANSILHKPVRVEVAPQSTTAEKVDQTLYFVEKADKPKLLKHLIDEHDMDQVLVFTRTKHGANKLVKLLLRDDISSAAIHGNKSQTARQKALNSFKEGKLTVLVATDIAARGIDIDELAYVVNYDLSHEPETYVHRIGRTGRAGASGKAFAFCAADEHKQLRDIKKLIRMNIPTVTEHPFHSDAPAVAPTKKGQNRGARPSGKSGSNFRRGRADKGVGSSASGRKGAGQNRTRNRSSNKKRSGQPTAS